MLTIRRAKDRGRSQTTWLNSYHTFSFADYYDPKFMGFGALRVINEDTVQPGFGFGYHPHKDMEIISYVVEGYLEHADSMGTGSIIRPGEIQIMSAGTGIEHSEFNHSKTNLLHFLQIWIIPDKNGLIPRYQQKNIPKTANQWILIAAKKPNNGAVLLHQEAMLNVAYLNKGHLLEYPLPAGHRGWVQVVKGEINLNKQRLSAGDGAGILSETKLKIEPLSDAEILLFDLG
jgi:redox-sensitive bicupin YhaK (pirin superfamily)